MGLLDFLSNKKEDKESDNDNVENKDIVESETKDKQQKLFGDNVQVGIDFGGQKKTPREAAIEILEKSRKEMHVRDIAKIAIEYRMTDEVDFEVLKKKISSVLNRESKKKKSNFLKVKNRKTKKEKRGFYKIKIKPPVTPKPPGTTPPSNIGLKTSVIGTAGEYAVVSELLFNGFNANVMIIDDGIDIIASKDNRHFFIQVKTTMRINKGRVNFPKIQAKSFDRYNLSGAFYVFVFRYHDKSNAPRCDYFVFSASDIESFRHQGILSNDADINLKVLYDRGRVYAYNHDNRIDVSYSLNDFSRIK